MNVISDKVVGRLSVYRRVLDQMLADGLQFIYSHQLAGACGAMAAQVRRDLMVTGCSGNARRGYNVRDLLASIESFLGSPSDLGIALVGIGNLGRALMAYCSVRRPRMHIAAAFDSDPEKVSRVTHGCRCYPMEKLEETCRRNGILIGIITTPVSAAQSVADALVAAGVRGLMNFAPVPLRTPPGVYLEEMDVTMSLEKVAYFARRGKSGPEIG